MLLDNLEEKNKGVSGKKKKIHDFLAAEKTTILCISIVFLTGRSIKQEGYIRVISRRRRVFKVELSELFPILWPRAVPRPGRCRCQLNHVSDPQLCHLI